MELSNKNSYTVLFILLIFVFILNILTFKNGHNWENEDFVAYLNQTKSLANGTISELVSDNRFLIENSTTDTGTLIAPWGFPILLSPVYYVFGPDIYVMKVFTSLFFILSLPVVFFLFQDRLSNIDNLLLITVIAFNNWFFDFTDNVLSDIPFLFFSLVSLFLIKRFVLLKKIWVNKFFSFSLIGLSIFISSNIRSVGFTLLPALLFSQYVENRSSTTKKSIALDKYNYVPYLVFILFSVAFSQILPTSEATSVYFSKLSQLSLSRIIFDIKYYFFLPSRFFPFLFLNLQGYGFEYNKFSLVIYAVMLLFLFIGILKNVKEDYLFFLYMLITMPVIMFFSSRQGLRLLIPILPFFLYFLFKGLSKISLSFEIFDNRNPFKLGIVHLFSAGLIIISFVYTVHSAYQNITFNKTNVIAGPYSDDSVKLFNYIKANTNKNEAVIFYKPRTMFLFAERKSFALNKSTFSFDQLLNSRARYVACDKKENPYKLSPEDLRKNFNCPYENDTFIFCSLGNNSNKQNLQN